MIRKKPLSIWLPLFLSWMITPPVSAQDLPARFIVHFNSTATAEDVDRVLTLAGAVTSKSVSRPAALSTEFVAIAGGGGLVVEADPQGAAWLQAQPEVEEVEPDVLLTHQAIYPTDQYLNDQWALVDHATGIRAPDAWEKSTGNGVVIAVVDTGYLPHNDLLANLLPGYDMISNAITAGDGDGRDANPLDEGDFALPGECGGGGTSNISSWHGTHVAGIAAARANNAIGIAGVAYDARILPVRALGKCGGYTSDIADAIVWAAGGHVPGVPRNIHPAKVINLSLGGPSLCRRTLQSAIDKAREEGATVVVAAGNSNVDAEGFSPANCTGVVTVAATARNGARAAYSNYGNVVDLAAPGGGGGGGILSTLNSGQQTAKADSYRAYQGTSMAAPHVAGAVALLLAHRPDLTPDEVEQALTASARPFPATCTACGAGLLSLADLLRSVPANTPPLAVADAFVVRGATVLAVLQNDTDADGQALSVVSVTQPVNGQAVIQGGGVLYSPNAGFVGSDSFTYTVSDGIDSATARVDLTVEAVVDVPEMPASPPEVPGEPEVESNPSPSPAPVTNLRGGGGSAGLWLLLVGLIGLVSRKGLLLLHRL